MRRMIWMAMAALALLGGNAEARSFGGATVSGPYGIHASRLAAQARAPERRHGFENLEAAEFPAIGTFTWEPYNRVRNAAFGMTYRTQRHLQARRKGYVTGGPAGDAGPLDAARPLASYDEADGSHRRFVVAVQEDVRRVPATLGQARSAADMVAAVLARLEGKQRASLTLALRSRDGARVRPLLLYAAEKRGEYWECSFYDPHLQVADVDAEGQPVSHVFGAPREPGAGRFHQLRFPASGVGRPQVAHSWVSTLDWHEQDGAAFAPASDVAWLDLEWTQLFTVDHRVDAWDPAGVGAAFDVEVALGDRRNHKDFTFGGSDAVADQTGVELD